MLRHQPVVGGVVDPFHRRHGAEVVKTRGTKADHRDVLLDARKPSPIGGGFLNVVALYSIPRKVLRKAPGCERLLIADIDSSAGAGSS
jgi:hypothetical protein